MLFHTIDFLLFFSGLYAAYRLSPARVRPWILLLGSLFFYAYWKPAVALLLLAMATCTYTCALRLELHPEDHSKGRRRSWLVLGVAFNLGCLIFFKYSGLLADIFSGGPDGAAGLALPIGISFYAFQLTAYLIDVSRAQIPAVWRFRDLLLFTAYFPQLISGPIERARRLLPRLVRARPPGIRRTISGLQLAGWGLFKKLFVADNLAPFTSALLSPGSATPTGGVTLGACVFAIQLYADFSGYVDMARGVSRMLGIELSANFRLPILATGPAEFWRRWHVTLYAFFRDYVYLPLGGGRGGPIRTALNVVLIFFLGGLWHGAGWPFAVWGLYCGVLVVIDISLRPITRSILEHIPRLKPAATLIGMTLTFLTFAHGLLLFHVQSTEHAAEIWRGLYTIQPGAAIHWTRLLQIAFFIWPLPLVELWLARPGGNIVLQRLALWKQVLVLLIGTLLLILFGAFGVREFYYFQF